MTFHGVGMELHLNSPFILRDECESTDKGIGVNELVIEGEKHGHFVRGVHCNSNNKLLSTTSKNNSAL